ncbi:MAG: BMC domain-containing protein [Clostridiales Family XIII bacterium]|nr:BMC domain-containing protein [Clostridiales Family XIII bacterium]
MNKAIGMLEVTSIARGIYMADQMVKISEVDIVTASSTCPGKYIAIVHGDVASVEDAVHTGERFAGEFYVDSIIIPNVNPHVFPAIVGAEMPERIDAIGIVESYSMSQMVISADAILKSAELDAIELRLGTGLGGKAYFTFTGDVAAVTTGVDTAKAIAADDGLLVDCEVIASPSDKLIPTLI